LCFAVALVLCIVAPMKGAQAWYNTVAQQEQSIRSRCALSMTTSAQDIATYVCSGASSASNTSTSSEITNVFHY